MEPTSKTEGERNKGGTVRLSSMRGTDEAMAKYEVEELKKTSPAAESSGGGGMVELKTFRQQGTSLDGSSVSPMPLPQSGSAESPSHQRPDAMKDDAERANESPSAAWRAWSEAVLLDTESLDFGGALPVNKMYLEAYLEMLRKLPFDTATLEYVDNQLREFFVDMPPTMDVSVEDSTNFPHLQSVKDCFIRGSVIKYVQLPASEVDTELLQDATRREAAQQKK